MTDKPKRKRSEKSKSVHQKRPLLWWSTLIYTLLLLPYLFETQYLAAVLTAIPLSIGSLLIFTHAYKHGSSSPYYWSGLLAALVQLSGMAALFLFIAPAFWGFVLIHRFLSLYIPPSFFYQALTALLSVTIPVFCFAFLVQLWLAFVAKNNDSDDEKEKNDDSSSGSDVFEEPEIMDEVFAALDAAEQKNKVE